VQDINALGNKYSLVE